MKFGKTALWFFKKIMMSQDKSRMANFPIDDHYRKKIDTPYHNDNHELHKFDLYYADEEIRKRVCVIDIHGGSFIFGSRKNTTYYKDVFLKQGFDFLAIDYLHNNGSRGVEDQIKDCVDALNYIGKHKVDLDLNQDIFVLTGDSAGGQLSLFVTLLQDDDKLAEKVKIKLNGSIEIKACLLNCPVYDFSKLAGKEMLNEGGQENMFGANFKYENYRKLYSPSTHIKNLKTPLFFSTCRNDFLREQSLSLKKDLDFLNYEDYLFYDVFVLDKKIGHVHNVNEPDLPESQEVNHAMNEFIKKIYVKNHTA